MKRATNPKPNRPLSTQCRDSRKNRGLSVDQLAKLANVDREDVISLEKQKAAKNVAEMAQDIKREVLDRR